jgi:hypothetical protein
MRGIFAPRSFSIGKEMGNIKDSDGFIFHFPKSLAGGSLVVFEDGSMGIKKDEIIYECDSSYFSDGVAVEISEKIRKIGDIDFFVTGYIK